MSREGDETDGHSMGSDNTVIMSDDSDMRSCVNKDPNSMRVSAGASLGSDVRNVAGARGGARSNRSVVRGPGNRGDGLRERWNPSQQSRSVDSNPSPSNASSSRERIMNLEMEAARKRYEIRLRTLKEQERIELEMIDKELVAKINNIDEDDNRSMIETTGNRNDEHTNSAVNDWLQKSLERTARDKREEIPDQNESDQTKSDKTGMQEFFQEMVKTIREVRNVPSSDKAAQGVIKRMTVGKNLLIFEGDVLEWPQFKRAFEESTRSIGYSVQENMMRLQESLRGEAKDAVASLMVTVNDTTPIIDLLQLRYGNPQVVADRIVGKLQSLPRTYGIGTEFVTFATTVKNVVAALEATNHIGYLHSPELMKEVTQRMSTSMIYNFNRYSHKHGSPSEPVLVTFSKFLFFEAEIACKAGTLNSTSTKQQRDNKSETDKDHGSRKRQQSKYGNAQRVHAVVLQGGDKEPESKKSRKNDDCRYCNSGSHRAGNCEELKKLPLTERWDWARRSRVCFRCLNNSDHRQNKCLEKKCGVENCSGTHHMLLHGSRTRNLGRREFPRQTETRELREETERDE